MNTIETQTLQWDNPIGEGLPLVSHCQDISCFAPDGTKHWASFTGFRIGCGEYEATIWECGIYHVWHICRNDAVIHMCRKAFLDFQDCLFDAAADLEMLSNDDDNYRVQS